MVTAIEANVVTAAAAGDPAALERLVSDYLPLVYNVVGRALPVAADVDGVVQETMLCVVRGLPTLRDAGAFRSWLVAVAMNQVRNHTRGHGVHPRPLDVADPRADFADLTLTELGLTGQRREVAMATAWLDLDDRELLSLWWLAEAGHITRGEVVTATGLDPQHVTVRVAHMKSQLEISRAVVRALCVAPICPELSSIAVHWPRRPEPLWRKRFARHIHECPACAALAIDFVPAERLLVGLPLLPVPLALTDTVFRRIAGALQAGVLRPAASFQPTQVYEQPTQVYEQPAPSYPHQPPIDVTDSLNQPPAAAAPTFQGPASDRHPAPHSHRRISKPGARTTTSRLAAKATIALAATAAVVGAAVVASNLDNSASDTQAGGAPDAVLSSTPDTSADASTATTSSAVASSATTSRASTPSTSPSSSAKAAPSTSQSLMKPPSSSGGNSAAATSAGKPPAPSSTSAAASSTPPSSSPSSASPGQVSPEDQVLALINQARADQGLPPLTRTAGLDKSAATHTSVMADGCGLSHQCPGEPGLGARETAAGVSWTSAGENIGDGGPVSNTNDAIAAMALGLTKSMLAEQPPNDGHRRNILSSGFHHIGISVYRDSNGTVWMTQDFSD